MQSCQRKTVRIESSFTLISVLVMKQPPEIIYTGMHEIIGNPTDYSNNKNNNGFERQMDLRIPTHKTDQKKPVKIGAVEASEDNYGHDQYEVDVQPISNSLNDNFSNKVNINGGSGRSPAPSHHVVHPSVKEEEKVSRIIP